MVDDINAFRRLGQFGEVLDVFPDDFEVGIATNGLQMPIGS